MLNAVKNYSNVLAVNILRAVGEPLFLYLRSSPLCFPLSSLLLAPSLSTLFFLSPPPHMPTLCLLDNSNFDSCISQANRQRFIGQIASAIHKNSATLVTANGVSVSTFGSSTAIWKDAAMIAANGGDAGAVLDYYTVNFWGTQGETDPFAASAASYGLDKPTLLWTHKGYRTQTQTRETQRNTDRDTHKQTHTDRQAQK